jgi:hypothetical protein
MCLLFSSLGKRWVAPASPADLSEPIGGGLVRPQPRHGHDRQRVLAASRHERKVGPARTLSAMKASWECYGVSRWRGPANKPNAVAAGSQRQLLPLGPVRKPDIRGDRLTAMNGSILYGVGSTADLRPRRGLCSRRQR